MCNPYCSPLTDLSVARACFVLPSTRFQTLRLATELTPPEQPSTTSASHNSVRHSFLRQYRRLLKFVNIDSSIALVGCLPVLVGGELKGNNVAPPRTNTTNFPNIYRHSSIRRIFRRCWESRRWPSDEWSIRIFTSRTRATNESYPDAYSYSKCAVQFCDEAKMIPSTISCYTPVAPHRVTKRKRVEADLSNDRLFEFMNMVANTDIARNCCIRHAKREGS